MPRVVCLLDIHNEQRSLQNKNHITKQLWEKSCLKQYNADVIEQAVVTSYTGSDRTRDITDSCLTEKRMLMKEILVSCLQKEPKTRRDECGSDGSGEVERLCVCV